MVSPTPHARSSGLTRMASTALVFAAGVLASDPLRYAIATRGSDTPPPRVAVEYTRDAVYIDKERYEDGRLGGPRCDWDDLAPVERDALVLRDTTLHQRVIETYVHAAPVAERRTLAYRLLVREANALGGTVDDAVGRIKEGIGPFRWTLQYTPPAVPAVPRDTPPPR